MLTSKWFPFGSMSITGDSESYGRLFPVAVATICVVLASLSQYIKGRGPSVKVPVEGPSGAMSSIIDAYQFIRNAKSILKGAYKKHGQGTFKITRVERYMVIINGRDLIEEIRKAPDTKVSFSEATAELLAAKWTLGENIVKNEYHQPILRNQLTRSLATRFDDIRDEIAQAFYDLVPANGNDWVAIPALDTIRNAVCRVSNRVFVGTPLCRDPDYIDLNIRFTIDVNKAVNKIIKVPAFLRPIVGPIVSKTPQDIQRGMKLLSPILEERFRMYEENGDDWPGKPADMISWFIDEAPENEKRSVRELTKRMLAVNFTAIYTTSNSFAHALFYLAADPQYVEPIREEVEQVIKEEGWTKMAMSKMWKLDSFMRESQRMNGNNMIGLKRKVMSDFTLSDGTFLPAGTFISANVVGIHSDDALYPEPEKFDGFRFSRLRNESAEESVKHQMVNTSAEYLSFGHGRHACPGRFFAVTELKAMMAYLVLNYDVKTEIEGVRPENVYHATRLSPNPKANVLIKKRERA